jgi:asparaginyl-tRNA synthetase
MSDVKPVDVPVEAQQVDTIAPEGDEKKEEFFDDEGNVITKSAYKKLQQQKARDAKKAEQAQKHAAHMAEQQKNKKVVDDVVVELTKPDVGQFTEISLTKAGDFVGKKIRVRGWCANVRIQTKNIFVEVRDGSGSTLQVVIADDCAKIANAKNLSKESSVDLYGELAPAGEGRSHAFELQVSYWEIIHIAASDYTNRFNDKSAADVLLDQRHLHLRDQKETLVLRLASEIAYQFRTFFRQNAFTEVFPPTIVQNQVEGGSDLFQLDYFGKPAYLTQSSQLYLEAAAPAVRNTYCLVPSYRAEQSQTRRHLASFMHLEGELSFIDFDELRDFIERLVMHVFNYMATDPEWSPLLKKVNPDFKVPETPFVRMDYKDAIAWLCERGIKKADGTDFAFGDDIPESPERFMVDTIGKPVFLSRFPTQMKPFYMQRDAKDDQVTESCDLLLPGVGEIVGGSMRLWDEEKLIEGYKREGLDPNGYSWYNDMRKYGSVPHGGFGLGFERLICAILGLFNIRSATLFPRTIDRATP